MYLATIDCGTTNSRVYIVDEQATIIASARKQVGVRDTAIAGNNEALKQGLAQTFHAALKEAGLELQDIRLVLSSGMITSEIGLLAIPHLVAPVLIDELAANITRVHDTDIFPVDIPVYFVRGIKNPYDPATATMSDVGLLDFMRGEEAQVAGLLSHVKPELPVTMVMLSSHTKFIPINKKREVLGSITTMSGQTYAAIKKETFIGKSIRPESDFEAKDYFDAEIVANALNWCGKTGFIRSLMMPRFLDVLLETKWYERELFVEALIAAEDSEAMKVFEELGYPVDTNYILVGPERRCRIYEHILKKRAGVTGYIKTITDVEEIDSLSIHGVLDLAGKAGLLDDSG